MTQNEDELPELVPGTYIKLEPTDIILTREELTLLWNFLSHQYISYDNAELINLVKRIGELANEQLAK